MSREPRYHDSSSPRRRSPPQGILKAEQDARHVAPSGPAAGIQIRGLARDREDQRGIREDYPPRADRRDVERNEQDYYEDQKPNYDRDRHPNELRPDFDRRRRRYSHSPSRSRSRSRTPRRGYHDRDMPEYRSPEPRRQNGSASPRRRDRSPTNAGPPSKEVMLDGLPAEMTEDDIKSELRAYRVDNLDDVRVIRDRNTGISRSFGFLRFRTMIDSKAFIDRNSPNIYLYGNTSNERNGQATPVKIAFSRERNDRERPVPEQDWTCRNCSTVNFPRRTECFRCKVSKADAEVRDDEDMQQPSHFANTGDSDVSDIFPSQFLLFRSLESSVTEELLAKGASKLLKSEEESSNAEGPATKNTAAKVASTSTVAHAGARAGCIRRVFLVRDKKTNESWRYGFVEFAAVEDAQAALARFNSLEKFTIASKPVMVSYIHAGVFKPVLKPGPANFSFGASNNPNLTLGYWDDDAYVNLLVVSMGEGDSNDTADASISAIPQKDTPKAAKDSEAKAKKRKADNTTSGVSTKKMASHLQFWTNRHNELHGIVEQPANSTPNDSSGQEDGRSPDKTIKKTVATPKRASSPDSTPRQSYADPEKHCCYLCSRQFKSATEVNKHERLSDLHKNNLKNAELVSKAVVKLQQAGIPVTSLTSAPSQADANAETAEQSAYRDRAKERRQAFNQPKQPASAPAASSVSASNPAPPQSTIQSQQPSATTIAATAAATADSATPKSKGAALLASMGYTPSRGLGAQGTGVTAPILTDMYAAGVGLGAEGGKLGDAADEAARATRGDYGEFAQRTRDKARERFERLG